MLYCGSGLTRTLAAHAGGIPGANGRSHATAEQGAHLASTIPTRAIVLAQLRVERWGFKDGTASRESRISKEVSRAYEGKPGLGAYVNEWARPGL